MYKYKKNNFMHGALRAGVCLLMLCGANSAFAQTANSTSVEKSTKKTVATKEISGHVYDAATKKPLAGVSVQALNNRYYSALTDDNGAYTHYCADNGGFNALQGINQCVGNRKNNICPAYNA